MPRTATKSRNMEFEHVEERAIKVEKTNVWEALRDFFADRRVRMVIGVLLLMFSLLAVLAYVSFLFTGTYDQSVLTMEHAERVANREAVRNMLGLPGAVLARFMIDGSFGFVSILLALMIGIYGLRLMHVFRDIRAIKLFCGTTFWVLWGAMVLGFAQQMTHLGVYRWGGTFGTWSAKWLSSYVNTIGTILLLFFALVIFLIVTDPRFIDRCKAFGVWVAGLIKRNKKDESGECRVESGENVLEVQPSDPSNLSDPSNEVTFTIDPIQEEEEPAPENPETQEIEVEIEEPLPEDGGPTDGTLADLMEKEESGESRVKSGESNDEKDPDLEIEDVIEDKLYDKDPDKILEKLGPYDPRKDLEFYKFPSLNLLKVYDNESAPVIDEEEQRNNGKRIVDTLRNYGIEIDSIKATVGPTVTLYEVVPKAGTRVAQIQRLENDIMMSLSATGIRIIAPMPGKGTVGIEVPNEKPQVVSMHSVIASKRFQEEQKMRLPVAYGRTITNEVFMFDLAKTPHLLVAGATGTGKSVAINAIITSLLYKKHPAELKLVMVDPKMVEFAPY